MSDQIYPGSPVMVKIDGSKVRAIREAKGLTQLYVATAVEVTTDTVSRWENKRYPSIKKENGIKLADALEVELDEILDVSTLQEDTDTEINADSSPATDQIGQSPDQVNRIQQSQYGKRSTGTKRFNSKVLIYALPIFLVMVCIGVYYFLTGRGNVADSALSVERIVAPHFIAGQPLPVFVQIEKSDQKAVSIIVKEQLPPGCRLGSVSPPPSGEDLGNTIKWLTRITSSTTFFFTVITEPTFQGSLHFSGVSRDTLSGDAALNIIGDSKSASSLHHWADANGDNRISDEEILAVYDLLSSDTNHIIDLDLLEEIWLGDGYIWQPEKQQFTIVQ
jgi:transcriptional regulator with XRE-family HTH domain